MRNWVPPDQFENWTTKFCLGNKQFARGKDRESRQVGVTVKTCVQLVFLICPFPRLNFEKQLQPLFLFCLFIVWFENVFFFVWQCRNQWHILTWWAFDQSQQWHEFGAQPWNTEGRERECRCSLLLLGFNELQRIQVRGGVDLTRGQILKDLGSDFEQFQSKLLHPTAQEYGTDYFWEGSVQVPKDPLEMNAHTLRTERLIGVWLLWNQAKSPAQRTIQTSWSLEFLDAEARETFAQGNGCVSRCEVKHQTRLALSGARTRVWDPPCFVFISALTVGESNFARHFGETEPPRGKLSVDWKWDPHPCSENTPVHFEKDVGEQACSVHDQDSVFPDKPASRWQLVAGYWQNCKSNLCVKKRLRTRANSLTLSFFKTHSDDRDCASECLVICCISGPGV